MNMITKEYLDKLKEEYQKAHDEYLKSHYKVVNCENSGEYWIYEMEDFCTVYCRCNPIDNPEIGDKVYLNKNHTVGLFPDDDIYGGGNFTGICCRKKDEKGYIKIVALEQGFIT
jgi:hypothetical protein